MTVTEKTNKAIKTDLLEIGYQPGDKSNTDGGNERATEL